MDASSRRAASPSKASSSGRVQERRGRVERVEGPWKRWWEDLKQRWRARCGTHPEDRGDEDETRTSRSSSFDSAMSSSFGAISDAFRSRMVLEEMEEEGDGPGTNGIDVHHERTKKRKQGLFLPGKRYIINPTSMAYRVWWMGTAITALLNSFFVPIEIGFSKQPGLPPYNDATAIIQYIVDAIFLLDIIVIFNLACFDSMGRLVKERKKIAKQYCKFYFWIDVLVLFPLDWVALAMSGNVNNGGSTAAQYTSLLRLLQLLRLYRFGQLQKKLLFYQKFSLEVVIVARVVITFLFLANIFASGFYFIARQGDVEVDSYLSDFLENFGPLNLFQRYMYAMSSLTDVAEFPVFE